MQCNGLYYLITLGLLVPSPATAQSEPPNYVSPEVHDDRRITFRLFAPKSQEVKLWGEWIPTYNTTEPLKRDERGIWSTTTGPVDPAIYSYLFLVDGVAVQDPKNPQVQTGGDGAEGNLVEVRRQQPAPYQITNVPHGTVHAHLYNPAGGGAPRRVLVYTPPDYDRDRRRRFPVLYLLHGAGETEAEWTSVGRVNHIADNLIATGKAYSMLIVMPYGNFHENSMRAQFYDDLQRNIIPLVDSTYRTLARRDGRAIAGKSMGAFQSLWFALDHPDVVASVGVFGGGIFGTEGEADVVRYAKTLSKARTFSLFQVRVGDRDMNRSLSKKLHDVLTQHGISHEYELVAGAGHTWPFWRQCLVDLLPVMFRGTK